MRLVIALMGVMPLALHAAPHDKNIKQITPHMGDQALRQVMPGVYAEPAYPLEKDAQIKAAYDTSVKRISAFYEMAPAPASHAEEIDVIFCRTQRCATYFAGTAQRGRSLRKGQRASGASYTPLRTTIVVVKQGSKLQYAQAQLAHELAHAQSNQLTGNRPLGAWFDEGLATLASGQPRCGPHDHIAVDGTSDHHLQAMRLNKQSWMQYTQANGKQSHESYCQAAHAVNAWLSRHGKPGLMKLLARIKAGESFDTAYQAASTKP